MVAREKLEEAAKKLDIRGLFISAIVTALALVVGLFWNDAIRSAIEQVIPTGEKVYYKFVAAIVVTIVVVVISYLLYRSQQIKIHDIAKVVDKERTLARQRFRKSTAFLRLPKKERERIRRDIIKGQ
jgi:uncharacterized membrane protein